MQQIAVHKYSGKAALQASVGTLLTKARPAVAAAELEWKTVSQRHAPDFCALWSVAPDENQLSELIANLLNPRGSHGQGSVFLKQFTARCGRFGRHPLENITIHRESHTVYVKHKRRRLDILIDGGRWGIGIENKPWANEQIKQFQDYAEDLDKRYKGKFLLIRLAGRESEVKSFDPGAHEKFSAGKQFVTWQYATDLLSWLEDCRKVITAAQVIGFLKDFSRYLDIEFVSGQANKRNEMEQKHLIPALESILKKDPSQLLNIAAIAEQFPALRHKMVDQLFDEVQKKTLENLSAEWRSERSGNDFVGTDWASFGFTHKKWAGFYWVRLESQPRFGTVALGVWHNLDIADIVRDEKIAAALKGLGWGLKSGGHYWQGYSPLREPFADWHTASGFVEVFQRRAELKAQLIEEFLKLCRYFEKPLAKLAKEISLTKADT